MFWRRRVRETPDRDETSTLPPEPSPEGPTYEDDTSTQRHEAEEAEEAGPDAAVGVDYAEAGPMADEIHIERDAPRAAAISRAAEDLNERGERVVELFEEVESPGGRAVMQIHARRRDGSDAFFEVETGPWDEDTIAGVLGAAAVLRASRYADAHFEVLGAYPVPPEVRFFSGASPAALFQLDLVLRGARDAPGSAASFVEAANRHWGLTLDYAPEGLPLVEDLIFAALTEGAQSEGGPQDSEDPDEGGPFVLDVLAFSLGCYVGETLRRAAEPLASSWTDSDGGEDPVLEFDEAVADPIGKARAFLENGDEDSIAYYASYVIGELKPEGDQRV